VFTRVSLAVALTAALAVVSVQAAGAPPTRREAASFQQKIEALKKQTPKRRTIVTENELAAYFMFAASKDLPVGIVDPSIKVVGPDKLSGRAVVDLDAVRKASPPTSLLDPKNLLIGRVPLSAVATFTGTNGMGKFVLESAKIGNLPLPKLLLDEIASYYTRSEARPRGYTTEDPWPLPAGIREIRITPGQALIIQ
jgi:hypothetical protein